jgi:c(7)-type cytochrome triheme protein
MPTMKHLALLASAALFLAHALPASAAMSGQDVYKQTCFLCHASGISGAPKFGNASDWNPRTAAGNARLYENALKGTAKGMPPKGGNMNLSDAEVKVAVDYMVAAAKAAPKAAAAAAPAKPALGATKAVEAAPANTLVGKSAEPLAAPGPADTVVAAAPITSGDVNSFNRLLKPAGKRNLSPMEDGIHDPTIDSTQALMPPLTAYADLPKSLAGNRVNWVEALASGKIKPRWDRNDPKAEAVVMDLNIVREVKGTMPDVVYPHKQHTAWLDCSNCHPAIFIPQKGANAISMAAILLGEKCGVCHGKVAFPVSECRLCHSKKKDAPMTSSLNNR